MAIRNDQYLFREGPGRGEISPQDPLETRLYDANGNIYDKDNPFEVRVRKLEEILGLAEENPEQYTLAARLKRIEDMLESGSAKVTLTGRIDALRNNIATGSKTVTATAAEIFAGSSRLNGRHAMVITNVGADHVYIGASGVTTNNGFPLFPGDTIRIDFNPSSSVPVFAVSNGPDVQVRVVELA